MANETVEQVCDAVIGGWRVLAENEDGDAIRGFTEEDMESFAKRILAAHKRETDELKRQIGLAKKFFNWLILGLKNVTHSEIRDKVCETEFKMNHKELLDDNGEFLQ